MELEETKTYPVRNDDSALGESHLAFSLVQETVTFSEDPLKINLVAKINEVFYDFALIQADFNKSLAIEIFKAAPKAKMPTLPGLRESEIQMIEKAKERVIEIEAEIKELEKLKNRTYNSCLAILEPKEPLSKFPSIDPELLKEFESLEDLE